MSHSTLVFVGTQSFLVFCTAVVQAFATAGSFQGHKNRLVPSLFVLLNPTATHLSLPGVLELLPVCSAHQKLENLHKEYTKTTDEAALLMAVYTTHVTQIPARDVTQWPLGSRAKLGHKLGGEFENAFSVVIQLDSNKTPNLA